jgi:hypothetical protein
VLAAVGPGPISGPEQMNTHIRYWQSVLREAERELDAATLNTTLKVAARQYMRAKAELKRLEDATT